MFCLSCSAWDFRNTSSRVSYHRAFCLIFGWIFFSNPISFVFYFYLLFFCPLCQQCLKTCDAQLVALHPTRQEEALAAANPVSPLPFLLHSQCQMFPLGSSQNGIRELCQDNKRRSWPKKCPIWKENNWNDCDVLDLTLRLSRKHCAVFHSLSFFPV